MAENPYSTPEAPLYGGGAAATAPKPPSFLEQVTGVFTEPTALFQKLRQAPSWVPAVISFCVLGILVTLVWGLKVDADAMMRPMLERNPNIPAAQIDTIIDMQKKFILPFGLLGAVIAPWIMTAFMAFWYWLVGKGTAEAEAPTFEQALSAASVPSLVGLVHGFLMIVMALLRPVGGLTPEKLTPTSLGYFVAAESPKAVAALFALDIFAIATWCLTFLAFRHLLRLKPAGAVICTFLLVLFQAGFKILFAK
ncbi:MAG TPA: YIP1 family protein [Holophagaceae bacterium]|nr:YIP1 family protein [Holophagaceae bacterium]